MNGTTKKPSFINGQHLDTVSRIPFGRSNIGHAGCAAIASYNLLLMTGRYERFESVVSFYNDRFRRFPFSGWGMHGHLGSTPRDIARFLGSRGIPFRRSWSLKHLESLPDPSGAYIILYWNKPFTDGSHAVAVSCIKGRYTAYNHDCDHAVPSAGDRLADFMHGKQRFICGFFVSAENNG